LILLPRIHVPDSVDYRGGGHVRHALLWAEPAELAVIGQLAREGSQIIRKRAQAAALQKAAQVSGSAHAQLIAAPQREGESIALQIAIGMQNAICSGVVGILVHRIGADTLPGSGKAQVQHLYARDDGIIQSVW